MKPIDKVVLLAALTSLTFACGGSTKIEKNATDVYTDAQAITGQTGTAKGSDYSGKFTVKVTGDKLDCRDAKSGEQVSKKNGSTESEDWDCHQKDGAFECTGMKGSINIDGSFAIAVARATDDPLGLKESGLAYASLSIRAKGKFSNGDSAKGTADVAMTLEAKDNADKVTCTAALSFEMSRTTKAGKDEQGQPSTENPTAQLQISYVSPNGSGTRNFSNVRVRATDDGIQIGAKGTSERAVITLWKDGTADLQSSVKDIDGKTVLPRPIEDCVYKQVFGKKGTRRYAVSCPEMDATVTLP